MTRLETKQKPYFSTFQMPDLLAVDLLPFQSTHLASAPTGTYAHPHPHPHTTHPHPHTHTHTQAHTHTHTHTTPTHTTPHIEHHQPTATYANALACRQGDAAAGQN